MIESSLDENGALNISALISSVKSETFDFDEDLFLALLLALIAKDKHVLLTTSLEQIDRLSDLVARILTNVLGLAVSTITANPKALSPSEARITVKECLKSLFQPAYDDDISPDDSTSSVSPTRSQSQLLGTLPNAVVVSNVEATNIHVQAILLEIITNKKLVVDGLAYITPEPFIIIACAPKRTVPPRIITSLLSEFFLNHHCAVVQSHNIPEQRRNLITENDFAYIRDALVPARIASTIDQYTADLISNLRFHRFIRAGSVPAIVGSNIRLLTQCLVAIHGLKYATPNIVKLAFDKCVGHQGRVASDLEQDDSESSKRVSIILPQGDTFVQPFNPFAGGGELRAWQYSDPFDTASGSGEARHVRESSAMYESAVTMESIVAMVLSEVKVPL